LGPESVLRGLTIQSAQQFGLEVTDALRNLRLEAPGNVDVAAADVFRSRFNGLQDYNTVRTLYGLPSLYGTDSCVEGVHQDPLSCFEEITSNHTLAVLLRNVYSKVSLIDPIVALHAEDIHADSSVGTTTGTIELTQLRDLRDGDRFFWLNYLSASEIEGISRIRMSDILKINFPDIVSLFDSNVFFVNTAAQCYMEQNGHHGHGDDDDN